MLRVLSIALSSAVLAGCAIYSPAVGYGRGYSERELADGTVRVTFRGDTQISKDATVKYWLYRCAELAHSRGFGYFAVVRDPDTPRSEAPALPYDRAPGEWNRLAGGDAGGFTVVRGGGVPIITFIPTGGGGTYWTKTGVVRLFRSRAGFADEQAHALHAETVLKLLKPLIDSSKEAGTPDLREVAAEAMQAGQPIASPVFRRQPL